MPALTRNPIRAVQAVTLLVDPNPEFVSLVPKGANQTPFLVVKAAEAISPSPKPSLTHKSSMPAAPAPARTSVSKGAFDTPNATEIQKLIFKGEQFTDEASVNAYMEERGYSNFTVQKMEGAEVAFVINALEENQFVSVQPIQKDDGVTLFVGNLTEAATAAKGEQTPAPAPAAQTEAQKTAPAAEVTARPRPAPLATTVTPTPTAPVTTAKVAIMKADLASKKVTTRKFDDYEAYYGSNGLTIADVLDDAADGIPVGFADINDCFIRALKNNAEKENWSAILTLCAEFGGIIVKLFQLTATAEGAQKDAVAKMLTTKADTTQTSAPVNPGLATSTIDITATANDPTPDASGAPAWMATLLAKFNAWEQTLNAALAEAKAGQTAVAKLEGRIAELEAPGQTRKSAEVESVAVTSPGANGDSTANEPPVKKGVQKARNNLFGV